jgi:hypothetical protein
MHLIPGFLLAVCSTGMKPLDGLLTTHLFNSNHKISGKSIKIWLGDMEYFKQVILDHLAQPVHPMERELFDNVGHRERVQYVIHCLAES